MTVRYDQMLRLVRQHKPGAIIEIGVHRAARATLLSEEALHSHAGLVHYIGFDVFETKDDEFQRAAMNGKGTPTEREARARLDKVKALYKSRFDYELFVGDTRDTLHHQRFAGAFAFIDGDHRIECIRADYEALKDAAVVVFDDYYVKDSRGALPIDVDRFGCNRLVDELAEAGRRVDILPATDPCKHGGCIRLAVVYKD